MPTQFPNAIGPPVLGCIADDVTGATDLAINLVQGGMRVVQVFGIPEESELAEFVDVDAIVVALKSRSIPKADALDQSLKAMRALQQRGVIRFYFKYCSTFDSTEAGNIGPVAEGLLQSLQARQTIFCPAFPRAGRTVYQGHLFVGNRLLCESGMERHPLTPMTDANLVRVLSKQTSRPAGLLPHNTIAEGVDAVQSQLTTLADEGNSFVIVDACNDRDLGILASAVAAMPLITGGSGLARFLPQAYRHEGILNPQCYEPQLPSITGRSLIVAGSCSTATNAQINWMKGKCPAWQIDVPAIALNATSELEGLRQWVAKCDPHQPILVASTASPDQVSAWQERFGRETVASLIEEFLASVTAILVDEFSVRRLVLAGGETSGAIVRALGIRSLVIGPEICAGVPWTVTGGNQPQLAIALKSGNFGADNFFETALEMLA